jgi:hypothetical protein
MEHPRSMEALLALDGARERLSRWRG